MAINGHNCRGFWVRPQWLSTHPRPPVRLWGASVMLRCLGDAMLAELAAMGSVAGMVSPCLTMRNPQKRKMELMEHSSITIVVGFTFLCFRNFRASYNLSGAIVFTIIKFTMWLGLKPSIHHWFMTLLTLTWTTAPKQSNAPLRAESKEQNRSSSPRT